MMRSTTRALAWGLLMATADLPVLAGEAGPPVQLGEATTARCEALQADMAKLWPDATTRIETLRWVPAGPIAPARGPAPPNAAPYPPHCELIGSLQQRTGALGQHYAIRFHLRLPAEWNGRLLFQGGGGSNGELGDALGAYSPAVVPALQRGFAVVSQDSGHDNATNNDPAHGGILVFGFDEPARANYGHASLPLVAQAAKAAARQFYRTPVRRAYFVGCSKGGAEGMALAQRYPGEFDGIAASAPGFSLPRAAVAEAWDTQALAMAAPPGPLTVATLAQGFSSADFALVREAVLAACDADDGLKDGIIGDIAKCTAARVQPELAARTCKAQKAPACLAPVQVTALARLMAGAHDRQGKALYTDWAWDAGVGMPGWRAWKMGNETGSQPGRNIVLGGASLASDFTTPPTPLAADAQVMLDYLMKFDFDRDAPAIYATNADFPRSAWEDISARSSDLTAFRQRKGRMIVTQGVSDPVFSLHDTLAWLSEVEQREKGQAAQFVRVFPVPGMNHCGGGDATDQYDVLAPLMQWVEQGKVPDLILAKAGSATPWPGRSRPLCPFPKVARYQGSGDPEAAASFACQ